MIDWVTCELPCFHREPIVGGSVTKIDQHGVIDWSTQIPLTVVGSHDSSLRIRTTRVDEYGQGTMIRVDGNPVKWLQGHNLFGTDDLLGLVGAMMDRLVPLLGMAPTFMDRKHWQVGAYHLTRIDCTQMFDVGSTPNALAWIRQAEQSASLSHRGRGQITKGSTLYFGKHSRRWSLKFYAKGPEFEKHTSPALKTLPALSSYAERALRCEVVMRSMELKARGLDIAANWAENDPHAVTMGILGGLHMDDVTALTPERIDGLKPSLHAVYQLWKEGHDIRGMYPKPTFYRYRKQLLDALSIDIANVQPRDAEPSNVVPFLRIIEAKPMGVPDWAVGTDLYHEPKRA
jgi:II/X family phage/plasmid replication protein